jgi:hypothetical protein
MNETGRGILFYNRVSNMLPSSSPPTGQPGTRRADVRRELFSDDLLVESEKAPFAFASDPAVDSLDNMFPDYSNCAMDASSAIAYASGQVYRNPSPCPTLLYKLGEAQTSLAQMTTMASSNDSRLRKRIHELSSQLVSQREQFKTAKSEIRQSCMQQLLEAEASSYQKLTDEKSRHDKQVKTLHTQVIEVKARYDKQLKVFTTRMEVVLKELKTESEFAQELVVDATTKLEDKEKECDVLTEKLDTMLQNKYSRMLRCAFCFSSLEAKLAAQKRIMAFPNCSHVGCENCLEAAASKLYEARLAIWNDDAVEGAVWNEEAERVKAQGYCPVCRDPKDAASNKPRPLFFM